MPNGEGPAPSAKNADKGRIDPSKKLGRSSRTSEEDPPVPGPSNASPRQGYCSCCQALYNNVEQHILSPRHREVVQAARSNVTAGTLMERFLQDVLRHHPHRYIDTRPSHADLPALTSPLVPREELSEVCGGSDNDGASVGTREELPSSDEESCQLLPAEGVSSAPQRVRKLEGVTLAVPAEVVVASTSGQAWQETDTAGFGPPQSRPPPDLQRTSCSHSLAKLHTMPSSPVPQTQQTPPSGQPCGSKDLSQAQPGASQLQHRKAHRKTNRHREGSASPTPSPVSKCHASRDQPSLQPGEEGQAMWAPVLPPRKVPHRRGASSDRSGQIREVIEEVIERCCYGRSPKQNQQAEEESFHLSVRSTSESGGSEGWDNTVEAVLGKAKMEDKTLACLMEVHVNLDDQGYRTQLDSALNTEGGAAGPEGIQENVIEEVLPDLPHIPQSFVGKTWTQVMFEDDLKVDSMVREFRQGRFRCYFDSESLAKFGKHGKKSKSKSQEDAAYATWDSEDVLPLMDHHEEEAKRPVTLRKTRRRLYRLASRCQVVKVSHGTQTAPLSCPMVRQRALHEVLASPDTPQFQLEPNPEQTPDMKTRLCAQRLPASYCRIMTPLQPQTVVYVLSSPLDGSLGTTQPTAIKRAGRKRKSCDSEGALKYKYKKTPLKYYDPLTNRILKSPPKGAASSTRSPKLPHVRQLFRSLSPDINKERQGAPSGREGRRSQRSLSAGGLADLCASTSGSCLDGGGPSERGSSASSSRRALFSRSSVSSSSRFLLGSLAPSGSLSDSSSRSPAKTRSSTPRKAGGSGSGRVQDRGGAGEDHAASIRRSAREGLTEKPLTPAKRPSAPPYRTRRRSAKPRTKAHSLQRSVRAGKTAESRKSPRTRSPARTSPRLSAPVKPAHKAVANPPPKALPTLIRPAVRKRLRGRPTTALIGSHMT